MRKVIALLALTPLLVAQEPKRPRILGVAHIALFVSDIEKSRTFYKDFLGFGEPFRLDKADDSLSLTFIKINDRQYVELFPGLQPGADRLNHISIQTDNAEAMRVYLGSRSIKVPDKTPKGRIRNSNFNVKDPDGHTVEIVQYEPDGWSIRENGKFMPGARISDRMKHLGIIVGDLKAANQFYGDILGFHEIWRGSSKGDVLSWTNMQVPDGDDYIEFMLYKDLPAPDHRLSQHHICLIVPDMAQAKATLEARAASASYTKPMEIRTGTNRKRQMNLYDPDGTRVELMEPDTIDGKPTPSSTAPPPR
jgi:catechol 2,3-dioxygenase-like lactoylglutathione lyase family enzyme